MSSGKRLTEYEKGQIDAFRSKEDGYLKIAKDGFYAFTVNADDGSKLLIDDVEIAGDNAKAALRKGYHKITLQYYDSGGDNSLQVLMQPEGGPKAAIPAAMLFHDR